MAERNGMGGRADKQQVGGRGVRRRVGKADEKSKSPARRGQRLEDEGEGEGEDEAKRPAWAVLVFGLGHRQPGLGDAQEGKKQQQQQLGSEADKSHDNNSSGGTPDYTSAAYTHWSQRDDTTGR
ncbi:hypothetical protein TWF696_005192 [Orbilia brochopaga]|uniref:Uncharacterized protein n=1 Tax=Orbilia brochopaga TaxID=3140254 RepID=A0AAV9V326_9PEZI